MSENNSAEPFEQFRADVDAVEKKMAGEIDPGVRAVVVAVLVVILLASLALPHTGGAKGYDVLMGNDVALGESIALPSRVFTWFALVFGVVVSMLALTTRRWVLAWIAVCGSAVATVFGMLSIWSRQTLGVNVHGGGVGIGLVIGWIAVAALTFHWLRVVWSRTALQLEAEEQRRIASKAEDDHRASWRDKA
ncbi:Rv2732c family membrane protein [Antrihabitans cavernicola]|uniref:Transmembrane protein n=1 Tax=Antrihabitans cavernicola TaxID=2495913 RepID=A0A5A7SBQ3_9NOCA|nr:hypothetical protein [Spelaeibacter cavernicola]KAA0023346.1 hypothetical protein FOY51_07990 [Spelaeibacter cavernicola]